MKPTGNEDQPDDNDSPVVLFFFYLGKSAEEALGSENVDDTAPTDNDDPDAGDEPSSEQSSALSGG